MVQQVVRRSGEIAWGWVLAGCTAGLPACGALDASGDKLEAPALAVDITEPVDGQVVQATELDVVGEVDRNGTDADLTAQTTWVQWSSEPPGVVDEAACIVDTTPDLLVARCPVDTSAMVEWVAFDAGTDTPDGPVAGGDILLPVWRDNDRPEVVFDAPSDGSVHSVVDPLSVDVHLTDDDPPTSLQLAWQSSQDGPLTPVDETLAADGRYTASLWLEPGEHTLTVTVFDTWGSTGTAEVQVSVLAP